MEKVEAIFIFSHQTYLRQSLYNRMTKSIWNLICWQKKEAKHQHIFCHFPSRAVIISNIEWADGVTWLYVLNMHAKHIQIIWQTNSRTHPTRQIILTYIYTHIDIEAASFAWFIARSLFPSIYYQFWVHFFWVAVE